MASSSPTQPPLADALAKNEAATAEVKNAADHLAVIHAVLETKGADIADQDVAQAIAQSHEVEKRLDHSAKKLDDVNEVLRGEVGRR